jgi:hypothetical protein
VSIVPNLQFEPAPSAESPFYRIERIDETGTAQRIAELVASTRPEWRQRPVRRSRRA